MTTAEGVKEIHRYLYFNSNTQWSNFFRFWFSADSTGRKPIINAQIFKGLVNAATNYEAAADKIKFFESYGLKSPIVNAPLIQTKAKSGKPVKRETGHEL